MDQLFYNLVLDSTYYSWLTPTAIKGFVSLVVIVSLAVFIAFLRILDRKEPEPRWVLFLLFVTGFFILDFIYSFVNIAYNAFPAFFSFSPFTWQNVGSPIIEEIVKAIPLILLIYKSKLCNQVRDGFIYGAILGSGFALSETIAKLSEFDFSSPIFSTTAGIVYVAYVFALMRIFLGHALFTGIFGYFAAKNKLMKKQGWTSPWSALVLVIVLHGLNNFILDINTGSILGSIAIIVLLSVAELTLFIWMIKLVSEPESTRVYN